MPTRTVFRATDKGIATAYYHWFFLVQPERLIGHDPVYYLHRALGAWSRGGLQSFASEALAEYERCFRDPDVIHASCEDYRAGADDRSGVRRGLTQRTIACPLLVLWGRHGLMERHFDVLDAWCERAGGPVSGRAIDCGHFLAEERPEETADELIAFFSG